VGKSVTIKHIIGLLRPDGGEIRLDGERIDHLPEKEMYAVRKRCAMVFQNATLFDSLTLLENVELPLMKHKPGDEKDIRAEAMRRLEQVHMQKFASAYPTSLGDGMRKRAAIARALTLDPECILFDEPTTGLDPVSARRIDALIRELALAGVTSLVVSHDLVSIFGIADRVAMIYQGTVRFLGSVAELRQSNDEVVRQFFAGRSQGPMETPGF
jgi:phospholipid/cholesterol/gamma-HCH transport system ATP-binding protein